MRHTARTPLSRLVALVTALLAAGLAVTGCATIPGRVGAAALVGETAVPIDGVQQQVRTALDKAGRRTQQRLDERGLIDEVTREILGSRVRELLLREAVRRKDLAVTDREVTALIRRLGGVDALTANSIYTRQGVRRHARNLLLQIELGRAVLPDLAVTVNYTTERTRQAAMRRVHQLAQAGPRRARRIIRNQVEQGAAAALGQRIVAAQNPRMAAAPPFGVPAGTVVAFPSDRQLGAWLVMVVTQRSTTAPGGDVDFADLQPGLLRAIGIRQLAFIGLQQGIRINPRYGVWDVVNVRVAPKANQVGGFVVPMRRTRTA